MMNQVQQLYMGLSQQKKVQGQTFEDKYGAEFVPETAESMYSNALMNEEAEAKSITGETLTTTDSHNEERKLQSPGAKLQAVNELGEVDSTESLDSKTLYGNYPDWPPVDLENPNQNLKYLELATQISRRKNSAVVLSNLGVKDLKDPDRVKTWVNSMQKFDIHPYERLAHMANSAISTMSNVMAIRAADNPPSDWANWTNTQWLPYYEKWVQTTLVAQRGKDNSTDPNVLKAALLQKIGEYPRNLSKLDFSEDGQKASIVLMEWVEVTRELEQQAAYKYLLDTPEVQKEMGQAALNAYTLAKKKGSYGPKVLQINKAMEYWTGKETMTLNQFWTKLLKELSIIAKQLEGTRAWLGKTPTPAPTVPRNPSIGSSTQPSGKGAYLKSGKPTKVAALKSGSKVVGKPQKGNTTKTAKATWDCRTCGRSHIAPTAPKQGRCPFDIHQHPDRNQTTQPWNQSEQGKLWKAQGHDKMPMDKQMSVKLDGTTFPMQRECELVEKVIYTTINSLDHGANYSQLPCHLLLPTIETGKTTRLPIQRALADTGSSDFSFVSPNLVNTLPLDTTFISKSNVVVSGALKGQDRVPCTGSIQIPLQIFNELNKKYESIDIVFHILDIEGYDMIVGRKDLRDNDILKKCHDQIMWDTRPGLIDDKKVTTSLLALHYKWLEENVQHEDTDSEVETVTNEPKATKYAKVEGSPLTPIYQFYKRLSFKKRKRSTTNIGRLRRKLQLLDPSTLLQRVIPERIRRAILMGITTPRCLKCGDSLQQFQDPTHLLNPKGSEASTNISSGQSTNEGQSEINNDGSKDQPPTGASQATTGTVLCSECSKTRKQYTPLFATTCNRISEVHEHEAAQAITSRLNDQTITDCETDQWAQINTRLSAIKDPDKIRQSDEVQSQYIAPGTIMNGLTLLPIDGEEGEEPLTHAPEQIFQEDSNEDEEDYKLVTYEGTEEAQARRKALVYKYRDVFSSKLPVEPARVTPMSFKVEQGNWVKPATRQPPRRQSVIKDSEIILKIQTLMKIGAIRRSNAAAWSQILLTPKPNNKWRFCIDFRNLNEATIKKGWPLPRIQELVHRIGHTKPKVFGKMDLTDGYFQMPLANDSMGYTAFTSSAGMYEWTRVPMGLTNAAAYFQETLTQEVLNGLVFHTCEVYIDDVAIHATTDEEFDTRLEEILERFRKHNIKVSGKKCAFGLKEIEILGYLVDDTGISFSGEKLRGVDDTVIPTTGTQLLSFLGLTNYFRDHVKDMHTHEGPLRQLAATFVKNNKIQWTPQLEDHFYKLKEAVWQCTKVHFVNPDYPIFLHTDACDHGIGAYLFQVDNESKELPIGFMSKSLRGAETRWSTFEQEGFAIYKALEKFEYLLRDAKFTIRTDHRNLLYMNNRASNKVQRWKNAIQQFNFDVEHIPGPDNIVADLYSRLNKLPETESPITPVSATLATLAAVVPDPPWLAAIKTARLEPPTSVISSDQPQLSQDKQELISQVHDHVRGHAGVDKTLQRLHDRQTKWPGMRQDITRFIRQCPACQFMKETGIPIAIKPFNLTVFNPMDRLNIDTIGPLPPDEEGNKHILVIIDVFSRFIELYPCKKVTAEAATRAILQHMGRYGPPGEILTDNGAQFIAEVTQQLIQVVDTLPITILPYSHEENGIVERVNKEVMRHLRAIIFDKEIKQNWSLVLPLVQRIHNATPHSSTQVAPSQLIFNNNIQLDRGILADRINSAPKEGWQEYILTLLNAQARILAVAQRTQEILNAKTISKKSGQIITEFAPNSYVLMTHYQYKDAPGSKRPDKLDLNYKGPFKVVSNNVTRYTLQNLVTGAIFDTHVKTLQPFLFDPNIVDPKVVARQAAGEFMVERVLEIRGTRAKKTRKFNRTDLQILVQWAGYDESYNTWEPYKELRHTDKFHQFCREQGYQYLIPPNL
jgi:hypothetical protein